MSQKSSITTQAIFDNLYAAAMVVGDNLCIEHMNPSAEMLFQISSKRAIGRSVRNLIINEHEFFDRLERSLKSDHPYTVFEASLDVHYGQPITVDYMVSPLPSTEPRQSKSLLVEFISMGRHQKFAQEQNLLSQQEVSHSLLRGLAHEIKNPLGGLRGAAQLLERELNTDEDREFTQIIIREADRLQNLVDRMLGPKDLPQKNPLNIHQVLEHVRQLVHAETSNVQFEIDYDPSLPDIQGDEAMLIQAILNITRNAVAAINGNGRVTYRTRSMRNYSIGHHSYPLIAKIEIIDDGEGIPDEIREKIFFPMVTGRAEGTGLGLSIAQSLINQHKGLIECDSKPGETRFTLLLPLENGHGQS